MSMANGGQAIYDLVPHRKSSKAFQARREGGRVETAQLQQTCRLQNERLQDKRVELRALRHERHNLESKTSALEGENVALAERRQELEARIALLETQTTELRRENTVLATRRKELEGRTAALEDEKMQLVGQKDELNTELVISNLDERGMLDDGVVKVRWAGLENVIFNIAVQRFGVPPGPGTPPEPVEVFEGLVAEPGEWLRDAARREWLIQAFLWKELVETVLGEYGFSARSYNLSGDNRRVYSDYLKALRGRSPSLPFSSSDMLRGAILPLVGWLTESPRRVLKTRRHHAPAVPETQSGNEYGSGAREGAQQEAHHQGGEGDGGESPPVPDAGRGRRGLPPV